MPELAGVSLQWLHEPWKMSSELNHHASSALGKHYTFPLVINETAMRQARARMTDARKSDGFADIARQVYARLGSRNKLVTRRALTEDRQLSLFSLDMPAYSFFVSKKLPIS